MLVFALAYMCVVTFAIHAVIVLNGFANSSQPSSTSGGRCHVLVLQRVQQVGGRSVHKGVRGSGRSGCGFGDIAPGDAAGEGAGALATPACVQHHRRLHAMLTRLRDAEPWHCQFSWISEGILCKRLREGATGGDTHRYSCQPELKKSSGRSQSCCSSQEGWGGDASELLK